MRLLIHKAINWEYWPTWLVYFPVFFAYAYYALRSKSVFYFNAVNPGFRNGGFANMSKKEIYDLIPQRYYPKTILLQANSTLDSIMDLNDFQFPLIAKPDSGLRGIMVKKITCRNELEKYHQNMSCDYLIQEFVDFENEVGLFYVRNAKHAQGTITGIVEKEFLSIVGDGQSTLAQLLMQKPRYEFQLETLKKDTKISLENILPANEKVVLVPYGNHNLGTLFLDASQKISPKLIRSIDAICKQIKGFNYGRIDIKFKSWTELEEGRNLSIIEINGAMSEPAHIYDPKHSFIWGIREILRHYKLMYEIAIENHRLGTPFLSAKTGVKEIRAHFKTMSKLT